MAPGKPRRRQYGSAPSGAVSTISQRVFRLSDYGSVDGLQMAAKVRTGDDQTDEVSTTYRLNVDYDESIFNSQTVRFEKNGWMKRR